MLVGILKKNIFNHAEKANVVNFGQHVKMRCILFVVYYIELILCSKKISFTFLILTNLFKMNFILKN